MKTFIQTVKFFDYTLQIKATDEFLLEISQAKGVVKESPNNITKYTSKWLSDYENKNFLPFEASYLSFDNSKTSQVYKELLKIKNGKTISYKELASKAKLENAYRFVGSTMAKNTIPLVVPCHRVLKTDGTLGNYSLISPDFKVFLLNHEK